MLVNMLVNKVSDVIWKGTLHTNGKLNNENMNVRMPKNLPQANAVGVSHTIVANACLK